MRSNPTFRRWRRTHFCRAPILAAAVLSVVMLLPAAGFQPPVKTTDGFAVPQPGRRFEFPRDHGSHPEFKIEWWYVTGHLFGEQDRRFGFQATFFRRAGPQPTNESAITATSAAFGNDELHLAHMALLDVQGGRFIHEERLNRAGWDAGSSTNTLAVWNGNWFLRLGTNANGALSMQGSIRGEANFSLALTPTKPLVVFGENGVSRKGASPTASSHYLTFSRLAVAGEVTLEGRKQAVRGQAWMDHEISSSQLDADQAGWDWASLQLNDGREIMAYRLRKKGGRTDPFSQLAWGGRAGRRHASQQHAIHLVNCADVEKPRHGRRVPGDCEAGHNRSHQRKTRKLHARADYFAAGVDWRAGGRSVLGRRVSCAQRAGRKRRLRLFGTDGLRRKFGGSFQIKTARRP